MPFGKKVDGLLDPQECYELWVSLGSLKAVLKRLEDNGIRNPKTGKPVTKMAVSFATYRYVAENPEIVRQDLIEHGEAWAKNDVQWKAWLAEKTRTSLSKKKYASLVESQGLQDFVKA